MTHLMKRLTISTILGASLTVGAAFAKTAVIDTTLGSITVELNDKAAPKTVDNFVQYAQSGFYNGTIFHRVIRNFMIQGGGFNEQLQEKPTRAPIVNEASNGLKNDKYTIAMARTSNPNSATSQFFINTAYNDFLNKNASSDGYAVFGTVTAGREVVDKIGQAYTQKSNLSEGQPIQTIRINKVTIKD